MADLERLSNLLEFLRFFGSALAVAILAVGLLRAKRDTYFYLSTLFICGYVLVIGFRLFSAQTKENWIEAADVERAALRTTEAWDFDPASMTSIHLKVPLRKAPDGRLRVKPIPTSWERVWQLADPENGTFVEIGINPVRRLVLLLGDLRCFVEDPNLLSLPVMTLENFARGICMLAMPVDRAEAEVTLVYEATSKQRGHGWDSRGEIRLETKADGLIDRIVTGSGNGTGRSFFLPHLNDGPSRALENYTDGPIVDLREWMAATTSLKESRWNLDQWRQDIARRAGLSETILLAGMENEDRMFLQSRALFLACTQWDNASPRLRFAITETLAAKLVEHPSARYLHECGRQSCTVDSFGLEDPKDCLTAPPQVVLPEGE